MSIRPRASCRARRLAGCPSLGENGASLFKRIAFTALFGRETFIEISINGLLVAQEPVFLCLYELEGMGDKLGGIVVDTASQFTLETLFGGGIEGERHGGSITLRWIQHIS